ncbi:MAG: hypothetical protein OEZ68_15260 [Gammaproteobacteria bacterium]|nr:hypothetical protein [Gammaproteobacteria bacterium]MDH5802159.1 hypothetical protein [Gammaproteobacteria bacterium]
MHTPIEFYLVIPCDLFRAGTPTKPKFDYIRTKPPRTDDQVFDLKIDPDTNLIDHNSGGLSLFNKPKLENGGDWWVIPAGIDLPRGFTVTKDLTDGVFKGHYSIRSLESIHIDDWKNILKKWAEENAISLKEYRNKGAV